MKSGITAHDAVLPHQPLSPSLPPQQLPNEFLGNCKNTLAQLYNDAEGLRDTTALLILTLSVRKAGNNLYLHLHAAFSLT